MKKICFFAKVNKTDLYLIQWYKNDIQILKDLGYKVILEPKSICIHKQASSSGLFSTTFYYFYHKNRIRFVFKNYSFKRFIYDFLPSEINWMRRKRISKENIPLLKAYLANIKNIFSIFYKKRRYIS